MRNRHLGFFKCARSGHPTPPDNVHIIGILWPIAEEPAGMGHHRALPVEEEDRSENDYGRVMMGMMLRKMRRMIRTMFQKDVMRRMMRTLMRGDI